MVMTVIWGGWQGNDHSNVLTEKRFAVRLATKVDRRRVEIKVQRAGDNSNPYNSKWMGRS